MITFPIGLQIPPLENGDRLSRPEFERRYQAMPHLNRAELIEGVVYIPTAFRFKSHGQPHSWLMGWLGVYAAMTPHVESADAPTVRLDGDNAPQPDAVLRINEAVGGQSRLSADDYIEGAPELVVEIAASSVAIDLHAKKTAYRRNGVQEYIVWRVLDQQLDWFYLERGEFLTLSADEDGICKSRIFPGLWLDRAALLAGNMPQVLNCLQSGLASSIHQDLITQLTGHEH
jgi:Uma2 family endonuclease